MKKTSLSHFKPLRRALLASAAALAALGGAPAMAQHWPDKPIRVIGVVEHLVRPSQMGGPSAREYSMVFPLRPHYNLGGNYVIRTSPERRAEVLAAAKKTLVANGADRIILEDNSKTVEELRQIAEKAEKPFILKGIMTVAGAKKALEAGASGIVGSNHGGRVLDQCPATAEVLPAIADAVGGQMTILVDGGIRTGMDVFKALALGADAVLIGRPFVNMVYGGGAEGVQVYVDKLKAELADTMAMCGAHKLSDIKRSMIFGY